jgi:hypothetical protein
MLNISQMREPICTKGARLDVLHFQDSV